MKYPHHSLKFVKLVKLQDLDSLKNAMRIHQGLRSQLNNVISKHSKMPPRNTKMVRDLFGSFLFLSLQRKVDMAEVFCYPLTSVPLSLCYTDGTILKSPKAKLLTELESRVKSEAPTKIDAAIVDGMFFLHLSVDPPKIFKQIAIYLLRKIFNSCNCKNIYLVFDKVVSHSIKDLERNTRSSTRQDLFTITGPAKTRPSDWEAALEMYSFKTSFVKFLVSYWENDELSSFSRTSSCL